MSGDGSSGGGPCKNIGVWVAIASNVGWLLILSYIVSMVHSEYASLSKQQMKLTANIKTLPDEWHDTSHILEVNQSTLSIELVKLQQTMKNLTADFQQLRAIVQQQQAQARDVSRVGLLEKSLADFGASLKSFSSEMDLLKSHLQDNSLAIDYFKTLIVDNKLNETKAVNSTETLQMKGDIAELKNATQTVGERLDKVNELLTSNAASEQQKKLGELERDHLTKINELYETVVMAKKEYQEQIKGLSERLDRLERGTIAVQSTAATVTTEVIDGAASGNAEEKIKNAATTTEKDKVPTEETKTSATGIRTEGGSAPIM